jgi:DNA-3-methyladenine glycosylase I
MVALVRCSWCSADQLYVDYHDHEWGVPEYSTQALFERLILESMQAGLSWLTVLKKRTAMRDRFFHFDIDRLAKCGETEIQLWLQDASLIRHRGKLQAMLNNARCVSDWPGFADWLWQFAPSAVEVHASAATVPSVTKESAAMSKALKRKGFRFVGPTTCYAFMQSVGMVNDHPVQCFRHQACKDLQGNILPQACSSG